MNKVQPNTNSESKSFSNLPDVEKQQLQNSQDQEQAGQEAGILKNVQNVIKDQAHQVNEVVQNKFDNLFNFAQKSMDSQTFEVQNGQKIRIYIDNEDMIERGRKNIVSQSQEESGFNFDKRFNTNYNNFSSRNIDIIINDTGKTYPLPSRDLDDNYKDILQHFQHIKGEDDLIQNDTEYESIENKDNQLFQIIFIPFDENFKPSKTIKLSEFLKLEEYKTKNFELIFTTVISRAECIIFPLKKQIVKMQFLQGSSLVFAGFVLLFLEYDNYNNSHEDNLDYLKFEILYKKDTSFENLKFFFRILRSKNVLFENLRYLKIQVTTTPEFKSFIQKIKEKDSNFTIRSTLQQFNILEKQIQQKLKGKKINSDKTLEQLQEEYYLQDYGINYMRCKQIVKKIYRQLCTTNLIKTFEQDEDNINNRKKSQKQEFHQDQDANQDAQDRLDFKDTMVQISKRHLLMCQNEKLYKEMKRQKVEQQLKTENILPYLTSFNMTSIFIIKNSRLYVESILMYPLQFAVELFKITFSVLCMTLVGVLTPWKVLFYKTHEINLYFNNRKNVQSKQDFIPVIIKYMFRNLIVQIYQAVFIILFILNISQYSDLSSSMKIILTLMMCYWVYCIFVVAILQLANNVDRYFSQMNILSEDMYDINEYQVSQLSYYLEFLEPIEDKYMDNIIPIIPTTEKSIKKFGLSVGAGLLKASNIEDLGKKWVSVQMLQNRYIYEVEPIATKDVDNIVEFVYGFGRPHTLGAFIKNNIVMILQAFRTIVIPILLYLFSNDMDNFSILLLIIFQSMTVYLLNFIPSGFKILFEQKQKLQYLGRVINLMTWKEQKNNPREVPIVNLFDLTSLESWHNLMKITYAKTRRVDVIKDMAITLHGFIIIAMLVVIILDIFGAFWDKFTVLYDLNFMVLFGIDCLVILYIVFRSLWFKVQLNQTYNTIINELDQIIALVTDISRNLPEITQNVKFDDNDNESQILGEDLDSLKDLLYKVGVYQLKRHAQIRLNFKGQFQKEMGVESVELQREIREYSDDVIKKYDQIKSETIHESIVQAEMFLGLVKVDDQLVKQIIIAGLIAGVTSGMQIILDWLQNK